MRQAGGWQCAEDRPAPSSSACLLQASSSSALLAPPHATLLSSRKAAARAARASCPAPRLTCRAASPTAGSEQNWGPSLHAYYRPPAAPPCWHHLMQPSCSLERQLLGPRVRAAPRHGPLVVQPALRQAQSKSGDPPCGGARVRSPRRPRTEQRWRWRWRFFVWP